MTDSVEIQKMLTREVREALTELSGFRQKDIAAQRRQRVKGNGVGRENYFPVSNNPSALKLRVHDRPEQNPERRDPSRDSSMISEDYRDY
jgi:hypothetical protein